ncbi:MAG: tetratricopeptide repeat protein, partial [Chloroflexota bacterium]
GLDRLEDLGMSPGSERSQFETITSQFRRKMALFVSRVGGVGAMEGARHLHQPPADRWWWRADEILAAERKTKIRRGLRSAGIAAAVLVALAMVYRNFFAPDPALQASMGHQQQAETLLAEGDYENALKEVGEALVYTPDEPGLYILKGVIEESLNHPEAAAASFDNARGGLDNHDDFFVHRAIFYLMMGRAERALADSAAALKINPDSAISYLNMGQAYTLLEEYPAAIESYQLADETAIRTGNTQLQVVARINLAQVLQMSTLPKLPVDR